MDQLKTRTVLFLEDNLEFAKNTTEMLEVYFDKVLHSSSIKDALFCFKNYKVDVIISDIKVTDGNGLSFIEAIRSVNEEIPIVILSAHKDHDFLIKAIPLKLLAYEIKPLSFADFKKMLHNIAQQFQDKGIVRLSKEVQYSYKNKKLYEKKVAIPLTKKESLFMELLLQLQGGILTYEIMQRDIWEDKSIAGAALKNFVYRLRKKTEKSFIKTHPNVGYSLL